MRSLKRATGNTDTDKIKYKFFVFDVETTCLEPMAKNFVFGCLYGYNIHKTFYSVEDFIKEFSKDKYKDKFIFAHNAEFDLLTVFGNIFTKVDSAAIFNGKFISAKFKDATFADSMNIYPTSVEKLGALIGLPKMSNSKVKEGQLRKNNITPTDVEYCMRDCEIVFKALLHIFEMTGTVKVTLPSLAMFDYRHNYLKKDLYFDELVDDFYESYYGGRTEAFRIGKCNAKVFDINSMYPAAMTTVVFPDVKHLKKVTMCDVAFLQFCLDHYEGLTKVTVVHSPTYFGYLPARLKLNGTCKLVFPVGEFITTVNFNELRFAIAAGVVKIKKVHHIIYGNPVPSLFVEYINDNFIKRMSSTNELERTIYKLKMNSLYGRFAMKLKMTTTYYEQIPFKLITELKEAELYVDVKLFNAIRADCFLVTENEKFKNSFFSIPTISSYITSEARVMLLKNLLANEANGVVYCDTDSIFLNGDFVGNVDIALGAFKKEDKIISEVRGLKNYTYTDEQGTSYDVIKGISRGSRKEGTNQQGETTYSSPRYIKTKASLRQNHEAGTAYTMVKIIRNNYDKREIIEAGDTRALISAMVEDEYILKNATKFIRTHTKVNGKKKRFRYEPQNVREAVMMFFINGGKIRTADMRAHISGNSNKELRQFFGLYEKNGAHMDVFCQDLPEVWYTDRIIDVFQDVLREFQTVSKMRESLAAAAEEQIIVKPVLKEYEFEYDTPF